VEVRVLLDTNAYTALFRGDESVAARVRHANRVFMSAIVVGELLFGFRKKHVECGGHAAAGS
jgi:predicted nucleic acid-binding protein